MIKYRVIYKDLYLATGQGGVAYGKYDRSVLANNEEEAIEKALKEDHISEEEIKQVLDARVENRTSGENYGFGVGDVQVFAV